MWFIAVLTNKFSKLKLYIFQKYDSISYSANFLDIATMLGAFTPNDIHYKIVPFEPGEKGITNCFVLVIVVDCSSFTVEDSCVTHFIQNILNNL